MAVDTTLPKPTRLRTGYKSTQQLLLKAKLDPDPVSVFVDGSTWEEADAAIFIVKGNDQARAVYRLLADLGLVTPGKPVVR